MCRLAKIARTQLCKVMELAKPAKMVRENPVRKPRYLKIVKFAKVPSPKSVKVHTSCSMLVIFVLLKI